MKRPHINTNVAFYIENDTVPYSLLYQARKSKGCHFYTYSFARASISRSPTSFTIS